MKKRIFSMMMAILLLVGLLPVTALSVDGGSAEVIYKDGATEKTVQINAGLDGEIAVQLPETVTAAGLNTKTGYSLAAWIGADGTEYEPGATITLTENTTTTLSVKWSLDPPTINVILLGYGAKYNSSTGTYTETYGNWPSGRWAFQLTVSHPLQAQSDFGCRVYHNGVNIHESVTNWWGNNRNPSVTSDDLACSLNSSSDSGRYWFVAEHGEYTSQPSEVKVVEIKPATLTINAKDQSIDISEELDTVLSSDTVSLSKNTVSIDAVAATNAVTLQRGNSLGNGKYQIRVVVTDANALENYSMRAGNNATLTITGTPSVSLSDQTVNYTGAALVPDPTKVTIEGHNDLGTPPQASDVTYKYFSDEACSNEIEPPVNKGTYYIKAYTPAKNAYLAGESNVATITIDKAALTITPKSWNVPQGATLDGFPIESLIPLLQTDGKVLDSDFENWVEWEPQHDGTAAEVESFLSGGNLVLKLGALDESAAPTKTYPICIDYVDENSDAVINFKNNFKIELNDADSTLKIKPLPSLEWTGDAADGVIDVEYTEEDVALSTDYFIVTDGENPATAVTDGVKGYKYYIKFSISGDGVTNDLKTELEEQLGAEFNVPITLTPYLPENVFLSYVADDVGIDLAALAEDEVFIALNYYAVPTYSNGPLYADTIGEPIELNIIPAEIEITAKPQYLSCTDPLIGMVNQALAQEGELELDMTMFSTAAEFSEGTMTADLEDAIFSGSLCLKLGEKSPTTSEHSYTQQIIIDYSSDVPAELLAMIPLLYDVTFVPGTLTVSPNIVELTWSNTDNRVCGDEKSVTAEITKGIDSSNAPDVRVVVAGGDETAAGTYTATATLIGNDAEHYVIADGHAEKHYTIRQKNVSSPGESGGNGGVSNPNPFVDVFDTDYYYDTVMWAVKNEITNGTSETTFSPNAPCSRAQIVTFLWRVAGCPEPKSATSPFTDVDMDSYYAKAVLWAIENGITDGTSDTTFSPNAECSRAQMATFLCRMADGEAKSDTVAFTDVKADAYYAEAVQWAVENGVTNGTDEGKFSPDATCTRAQMVTFLYRYCAE